MEQGGSHRVSVSDDLEVSTYLEIGAQTAPEAGGLGQSDQAQPPTARDAVAIIDFGSQYSQLIARRVREHHVYCELLPHDVSPERVRALNPKGFILSGGPASVRAPCERPDCLPLQTPDWQEGAPPAAPAADTFVPGHLCRHRSSRCR